MRSCAETLVCRAALTVYITTYASFRALVYFYFSYWLLCITSQTSQVEIHSIFVVLCLSFLCFVSLSLCFLSPPNTLFQLYFYFSSVSPIPTFILVRYYLLRVPFSEVQRALVSSRLVSFFFFFPLLRARAPLIGQRSPRLICRS